MARGRMLNNKISASLQFQQLPDDTCRLLATWIIAHLDKHGVFYGDPALVRSFVFPRRDDVSADQVADYLQAMSQAEDGDGVPLIILFNARGESWQYWPQFAKNQPGLRPEREGTDFPHPPAELPQESRETPAELPQESDGLRLKVSKGKRSSNSKVSKANNGGETPPPDPAAVAASFDLLRAVDFDPESAAMQYAKTYPHDAIKAWHRKGVAIRGRDASFNVAGYIRKHLDAGDPLPSARDPPDRRQALAESMRRAGAEM